MTPVFSSRTAWNRTPNRLAATRKARTSPVIDLTESNPTRCGLTVEGDRIRAALSKPEILKYDPDPKGRLDAREAIARLYPDLGGGRAASRIVLGASTSEAYVWLFRLLCEPGDEVLVPSPCYPLFDDLARLSDVTLKAYPLIEAAGYRIDLERLVESAGPRTRAVLVVSPGNPTGTFLKQDELTALDGICAARGLALVADEVFADYGIGDDAGRVRTVARDGGRALTFALSGLSKMLALPQLKLGWIATAGPEALAGEALDRLELIADTYLSVNTPVQVAAGDLLALRPAIQAHVRARLDANRRTLARFLAPPHPAHVVPSEGGWSAIVRVPATRSDEEWAITLVEQEGVLVQPGYFYDFPGDGRLVVSLLPDE
ncbi:MAG TPA: pyridoxal phosphate-dependent aminotransferase, partial [Verrucomicrobiae bacterium]|nr:pyridoxal phosphate-dependent aminotransferase [Verrucomicrobiae bacterium]